MPTFEPNTTTSNSLPESTLSTVLPSGRFARSRLALRQTFVVLRLDRELLLFPLASGLIALIALVGLTVGAYAAGLGPVLQSNTFAQVGALLLIYFVQYFITIYFTSGLVAATMERFAGGDPTFRSGLAAANRRLPAIIAYAAIAATVGTILRLISERSALLGKIVSSLVGLAWSLLVTFVVPVIVMTELGPIDAIKQSGKIFKSVWGESVIGTAIISLALIPFTLLAFIPALLSFALISQLGWYFLVGLGLTILAIMAVSIFGSACSGIYNAALYTYTTTGKAPAGFDQTLLANSYRVK